MRVRPRCLSLTHVVAYAVLMGLVVGCGVKDPNAAIAAVNSNNIQRLTNLYFSFQMRNDWRGPTDEQEFKAFLNSYNPKKLTRIGIDPSAIDDLFVNERDGEPFKVRYGVRGSAMGSSEPVVFEATGINGARMVGFLNMVQRKVDPTEYDDLWAGRVATAAPTRGENRPR